MSPQSALRSPLARGGAFVAGLALVATGAWLGGRGLPDAGRSGGTEQGAIVRPAGLTLPAQDVRLPGPQVADGVAPVQAVAVIERTRTTTPPAATPSPPTETGPTPPTTESPLPVPLPPVTVPPTDPPGEPPVDPPPPPVDVGGLVGPLVPGLPSL